MSEAYEKLKEALEAFKAAKPNDRGAADRAFAIVITELEKVLAYAWMFIERR